MFLPTRTLGSLVSDMRARRARSEAIRHLRSMPDAMLRDIGISRSEIESVVAGGGRARGRL